MGAHTKAAYNPFSDLQSWWALRGFLLQLTGAFNGTGVPYVGEQFDGLSGIVAQ